MWFAFDVLICAVYVAYALPPPLAAGRTAHFRFTVLLQFFISTEDVLSLSETRLEIKRLCLFLFWQLFLSLE